MTYRTPRVVRSWAGLGTRTLAVLVGLDAGLGWAPADSVSARLAAAIAAVALLIVVTGRAHGGSCAGRPDLASTLALAVTLLAAGGAQLAPPDPGSRSASATALLMAALLAGVAMVVLAVPNGLTPDDVARDDVARDGVAPDDAVHRAAPIGAIPAAASPIAVPCPPQSRTSS
jgi:hypothetical protein